MSDKRHFLNSVQSYDDYLVCANFLESQYVTFRLVNVKILHISLKISNFVAVTKYVKMRLNKKDTQYYLTKRYVVSQLLPHMTYRSGWQKIKDAVGDDPCLRRAFSCRSPYLYISEFQYLMRVF